MHTDKQIYKIFPAQPNWIFELTNLEPPGPCSLRSFAVKALERRADGLIVPDDPDKPLTVVEFQFQRDDSIYGRTVIEMVSAQAQFQFRSVQGIIFFRYNSLNLRTPPWNQIVHGFVLRNVLRSLERSDPHHPLVAVFQPVLLTNPKTLEHQAAEHLRTIKNSDLTLHTPEYKRSGKFGAFYAEPAND